MTDVILSPKNVDFINTIAEVEFMEGTTASGKTTIAIPKFMIRVAGSDKKDHVIAGADIGTVEKNIINSQLGLISQFEGVAEYHSSGKGKIRLPHIEYQTSKGTKIIYVCGYDNKAKWKKVLGSQMGCIFIDEINIADMEFLREISHRRDYMLATLNPDDPNLPVYKEFINHSRPLNKFKKDYPAELLEQLNEIKKNGWIHWYFTFKDNESLTPEDISRKTEAVPIGTKMYKNKILGLRGRATGLVFSNFDHRKHVITKEQAKKFKYRYFTCGVDTSYSSDSPDTIAFIFQGITVCGKCIVLDEEVINNADLQEPLAPSDVVKHLIEFLDWNRKEWGFCKNVFVDSADQATIKECAKYRRNNPCIYTFENAWKEMKIIDRIQAQLGFIHTGHYLVVEHCEKHIGELETYSWKEKKYEPEDGHDHTINGSQYGWIPFNQYIGGKDETT